MDDPKKKTPPPAKLTPDEKWLERLGARAGEKPAGVTTYIGLLRQNPQDDTEYQLYQTLDMGSCLHILKADVLHIEELSVDKSPFGSLGGAKVFVRLGAKITQVRTASSTFTAGAADDFDLDIRLGATPQATGTGGGGGGGQTIPDTGCGDECTKTPPFSDPDVGPCHTVPNTFCGCTGKCTIDTCGCPPTGQPTCQCTPPTHTNCAQTCILTNCGTCQTCQTCATNCGTCVTCKTCATNCGTCATHCGTCAANTCATKCGQATCIACTHVRTRCPGQTCQIP
jgi:hypothetical protein